MGKFKECGVCLKPFFTLVIKCVYYIAAESEVRAIITKSSNQRVQLLLNVIQNGRLRESNPGPLPPKGRIIPLDQADITNSNILFN